MTIVDINGSERNCVSAAPDPSYPGYVKVEFRNYHEWYSFAEFKQFNPTLSSLVDSAKAPPQNVTSVVTSATKTSLKDAKQNWKENEYVGLMVWISRGLGEGQIRRIIKNSHHEVTIDSPWTTKPNTSSQYVLSYDVHNPQVMGNTLPAEDQKKLEKIAKKMDKQKAKPIVIDMSKTSPSRKAQPTKTQTKKAKKS